MQINFYGILKRNGMDNNNFSYRCLLFGAKKIPELAKSMGRATSEFQKARIEAKKSLANESSDQEKAQQSVDREKLESIAETLGVDYSNKNDQDLKNAIDEELKKQGTPK